MTAPLGLSLNFISSLKTKELWLENESRFDHSFDSCSLFSVTSVNVDQNDIQDITNLWRWCNSTIFLQIWIIMKTKWRQEKILFTSLTIGYTFSRILLAGFGFTFSIICCFMLISRTEIQERTKNANNSSYRKTLMSVMAIIRTQESGYFRDE